MDSDCFIVDQSSSANSDCPLPDSDFVKDAAEDEGGETVAAPPASEAEDLDSFSLIEPPPLDWRSDSSSEAGSADDLDDSSMPPSADTLTLLGEAVMLPSSLTDTLIPADTNQHVLLKNKTESVQDLEVKLEKEDGRVKEVSAEGLWDEDCPEEYTFRDVEGNISKEVEDSCGRPGDEDHSHIHTLLTQLQLMGQESHSCQRTSSYNRCSRLSEHHPAALSPLTNNRTATTGLLFSESHQSDVLGLLQCAEISSIPQPSCLPHRGQVDAVVSVSYDQEDAQRFWGCDANGQRHRGYSVTSLPDDEYPEPVWMKLGEEPPEEDAAAEGAQSADDQPSYKDVPGPCDPEDLLDGVIFGAKYLGSTQIKSDRNPSTNARMTQAQEAVDRIKAPEGESQPMTEVDLFISTQRIKVLNADTQEAMMDHALQTISYIADIGNIVVLMARRKLKGNDGGSASSASSSSASVCQKKCLMICHVFSSEDAQVIAQAIGQAFGVAYQQFLQASGIKAKDLKPGEYSEYLESQELYNGDLAHFSDSQNLRDIAITKAAGEILGLAVVESGWGSILPTVVVANLLHGGPAERCGELSIGDRIMSVNSTSLVGLPITTCQNIIRVRRGS
uniref:Amyloid beta (A4) protein-binding, family A, member 3 n=1 Tax=Iconisemion striatum TaxID=60296 RepID=A0A1A7XSG5_9TELE